MKVTVVCSSEDPASLNIKQRLLEMAKWKKRDDNYPSYSYLNFEMIEVKDKLIFQDCIDRILETDLIIFASRHKSVTRPRPLLTAHFSGNVAEATLGGNPRELACAAPGALKSLMCNLRVFSDVEVVLEATHHGPSDIIKPSVFIELGSSEVEWRNQKMAAAVAKAIFELDFDLSFSKCPTAVGFGGAHYAIRHTELLFSSDVCLGHIFPLYQLKDLTKDLIRRAFEKSDGDFAYFDRKGMGKFKGKIESLIKELDYEVLRSRDVKEHGGLPWHEYLAVRQEVKKYERGTRKHLRVGAPLRDNTSNIARRFQLNLVEMDLSVIHEAQKVNEDSVRRLFDCNAVVYLERSDGLITDVLVQPDIDVQKLISRLQDGCIEILKEHYDIEYSNDKSNIYIIENKFNPQLAAKLGVTPGPLFAELTRGKSICIGGKLITSNEVRLKVKKTLKLIKN